MASRKKGQVALHGRFSAGDRVSLFEAYEGQGVPHPDAKPVAVERVGEDGRVVFEGLKAGCRYLATGIRGGSPLVVPLRARPADDAVVQPAVAPDRVRLADGSWADETPEPRDLPDREVQPGVAQRDVPEGVVQRSATRFGQATPIPEGEVATSPYPAQEDVDEGVVQRSDTETGIATVIPEGRPERQDQARGVVQRSATAEGVATPVPGPAVEAHAHRESAGAKGEGGIEPVQAAARPPVELAVESSDDDEPADTPAGPAAPVEAALVDEADESGGGEPVAGGDTDAQGQPVDQVQPSPLRGQELRDRARELDIEGRSNMTADELRLAVARAEAA